MPENIRVHLVQMEVAPGQPAENTARMLAHVAAAKKDRAGLVAFPEMAIPGRLLGDAWERESFLRECEDCGEELRKASAGGPMVAFGNVGLDRSRRSRHGSARLYNACFVAHDGVFKGPEGGAHPFAAKLFMPGARQLDDGRYFDDLRELAFELGRPVRSMLAPIRAGGLKLGCVLCSDCPDADDSLAPLSSIAEHAPDLVLDLGCSPFIFNRNRERNRALSARAAAMGIPMAHVGNAGIQNSGKTLFVFDGATCAHDTHGSRIAAAGNFEESVLAIDLPLDGRTPPGGPARPDEDPMAELFAAIRCGSARFLDQCGLSRVVIGASGGIDSALVAAIYAAILPPDRILLVNMPSRYNSNSTISLARRMADSLRCFYAEVPIEESARLTAAQIDGLAIRSTDGRLQSKLALGETLMENVQARDRSSRVLAAMAAAFGAVFTCNANKSEATVGYSTLYGDLDGFLANIADLWKNEVYRLARHVNEKAFPAPVIPEGSFSLPPSAELGPGQNVDEGKGDPLVYPYHDKLFSSWIERWDRASPEDLLAWYADGTLEKELGCEGMVSGLFPDASAFTADLERWWNLYTGLAAAKRVQAPPVLSVKRRTFGFDLREAMMKPWYGARYRELKRKLLDRPV